MTNNGTAAIQLRKNVEARILRARHIIEPALPRTVNFDEMCAKALLEIQSNESLANVTPVSVFWAFVHATSIGLTVSRVSEEAHIVPFKDRNGEKAQLIIGYKGMAKLAYQHPKIIDINSYTVFEDDEFEVDLGSEPRITFRPNLDGKRDKVRAAFCVVTIHTKHNLTGKVMQVMSKAELDKVRASSRGSDNPRSPWNNWYEEMCRKTVLRRTLKTVPRSSEIDRAMQLENAYEVGESPPGEVNVEAFEEETSKPKGRTAKTKERVAQKAAELTGTEVVEAEVVEDDVVDDGDSYFQ